MSGAAGGLDRSTLPTGRGSNTRCGNGDIIGENGGSGCMHRPGGSVGVGRSFGGDVRWDGGGREMEDIVDSGEGGTGVTRCGDSLRMPPR